MNRVPLSIIALCVAIHALWGGNPIGAKFGMLVFPPYWSAFIRFALGISVVLVWAWLLRWRVWPHRGEWRTLWLIGLMFFVQIATMNLGIERSTGTMASILIATNPLFAALFAHFLIADDRLTLLRAVGLLLAFMGVVVTILDFQSGAVEFTALVSGLGDWLTLFSAALLGLRLVVSARVLKRIDPVRVAVWQMVLSLPLFAVAGYLFEEIRWHNLAIAPVLGLLYQGVIVAGIGFMTTLWLMTRYQPSVMMSFNFVSPVVGVFFAVLLLNEELNIGVVLGVLLVALGLFIIARQSKKVVET